MHCCRFVKYIHHFKWQDYQCTVYEFYYPGIFEVTNFSAKKILDILGTSSLEYVFVQHFMVMGRRGALLSALCFDVAL